MGTLPPAKPYDPNVPVVTPAGGTTAAYKDPNSPETLMRKTAALNAQAAVDTQFDNATSAYATSGTDIKEGFSDGLYRFIASIPWTLFILLLLGLVLLAVLLGKTKGSGLSTLGFVIGILLLAKLYSQR